MKNLIYSLLLSVSLFLVSCNSEDTDDSDVTANPDVSVSSFDADPEDLDENGLPVMTFQAQQPSISGNLEYTIDLTEWNIPNNGTDPVTTTTNLQEAIDWAHEEGYTKVTLPSGNYLVGVEGNDIYQAGIDIFDNTEFVFAEGAVLTIDTNNKWNYCVLRLNGDNIIVRDGTITGDKDSHIFTPRESDGATAVSYTHLTLPTIYSV